MENKEPTKEQSEIWRNDSENWKFFGLIYYNKEDNRIFPPKRVEWMGWTVNFANPKSILALILFMSFVLFVIILIAEKGIK